jgi:hypothetical protein
MLILETTVNNFSIYTVEQTVAFLVFNKHSFVGSHRYTGKTSCLHLVLNQQLKQKQSVKQKTAISANPHVVNFQHIFHSRYR